MNTAKALVAFTIAALIVAFFAFDLHQYLRLDYLKETQQQLDGFYEEHTVAVIASYFIMYVAVTALSLPGAAVMTLAAGALFGLWVGVLLVSFASTLGATGAFAAARWLFRDSVQRRLGRRLRAIDRGIARDGAFYLFSLRLVPAIPFFLINLAMGLTNIRTWTFYLVSQVGMLPGTIVYVNAGEQLSKLDSLRGLLSVDVIGAFLVLAAFPWLARAVLRLLQRRRAFRGWPRPKRFDRNLVVIGAGSGGLVSAYIAATVKAEVTLVERDRMGGDCLNTGCVPSKALIKSAQVMHQTAHLQDYGLEPAHTRADLTAVMKRVHRIITDIEPHDSVERYSAMGVDCQRGHARLVSPWEVEITDRGARHRLTARNIVIATGARPSVPDIPGLQDLDYLTSDNLWQLQELPARMLVLGGGPIGCELAQALARLGSNVVQLEKNDRLLSKDEPEAAEVVRRSLAADGVDILLETEAMRFTREGDESVVYAVRGKEEIRLSFDRVLVALGRTPNTTGLGLDQVGIETRDDGTIRTDEYLQTSVPNVFACGDVAGPYQFTHTASHQAGYATINALFGSFRRLKVDYSVIPWTTFTDPEIAHVGMTKADAEARDLQVEITRYDIADLDRAIADGEAHGFIMVITRKGSDRILGATIVGADAGNLLAQFSVAMRHGIGLKKLQSTIYVYPTLAEAVKHTAGEWRKAHAPQRLLDLVGRYHHWRLNRAGAAAPDPSSAAQRTG